MASKKPGSEYFKIAQVDINATTATANFVTDPIDMTDYNLAWVVSAWRSLTTGNPKWTIQHSYSNDPTDARWMDFNEDSTGLSFPDSVMKSNFYPQWMRIKYTASGATGTVTMILDRTNPS